ncbi:hypothetical protein DPMN_153382 [Dreissena polymorpha]|uniref:Uncharacterized protein n=1 Tax=Dreissena polymorpha TaxID=45954 RepID=A0A9D4FK25_DREPO|nr:hypothetical protein DPMN_153382 [Dreissena polymorpha]
MHRFIEENGQYKWYNGTVISQVPGFPEWFNLKYEDDNDIYTARLEDEFQDGDVLIRLMDNVKGWTSLPMNELLPAAHIKPYWRSIYISNVTFIWFHI